MITGFLPLLCLGLARGYEEEHRNETLPKPSLHALPGSVVGHNGNVTLKCRGHFQNVTFMLGKWRDPGYRKEQSSGGYDAEFLLTGLAPKNAGMYFCAYKMTGSHEWSEKSEYLQLEVTDDRDGLGASSTKTGAAPTVGPAPLPADARTVFVSTFSCLAIFLLFPAVFLIYRCSQHGSSHEESTKRTSHSEFPAQEARDASRLEGESLSLSTEDPQEGTCVDGNSKAPAEAASVPAQEPPGPGDCTAVKV